MSTELQYPITLSVFDHPSVIVTRNRHGHFGDIIYPVFQYSKKDKLLVIILTGLYHAGRYKGGEKGSLIGENSIET